MDNKKGQFEKKDNFSQLINSNRLEILFLFVLILNFFGSHWTWLFWQYNSFIAKTIVILLYLPFFLVILLYIKKVIRERCPNKSLLLFSIYSIVLVLIRFLSGTEYMETIYCTVIFLGSSALLLFITNRNFNNTKLLLITCLGVVNIYWLGYTFLLHNVFEYSPININFIVAIIIILLPPCVLSINEENNKLQITDVLLILSGVSLAISGSRLGFSLACIEVVLVLLFIRKDKKLFKRILAIMAVVAIATSTLFVLDIYATRVYLARELWYITPLQEYVESTTGNEIADQIERSDVGRKKLMQHGLNEFCKNPILGTGDVYYKVKMTDSYTASQSSHNFIIESLVCYGIIGCVLMGWLCYVILKKILSLIHSKIKRKMLYLTVGAFILMCSFQPLFFNSITSVTMCISLYLILYLDKDEPI